MSAFWKHFESARDDVRHKLVEEAWFGRQVTGDTAGTAENQAAGPGTEAPEPSKETRHTLYEETWGKAPTHAEIYGQASVTTASTEPTSPTKPNAGHGPEL